MRGQVSGNEFITVSGGAQNLAIGKYSTIVGGLKARTSNYGQVANASGAFGSRGGAQRSEYILRIQTDDIAITQMYLDGISERMVMPQLTAWAFKGLVVGIRTVGGQDTASWEIEGLIRKDLLPADVVLVGTTITAIEADAGAAGWSGPVIDADTTNGSLRIGVVGDNGANINWVGIIEIVEVREN